MFKLSFVIGLCTLLLPLTIAEKEWWENGNFYQIYPRSFKDSNGDGIGDINGITEKLQYLKDLGVNGVWMSPIFKSPMVDFGYDISDYTAIQPEYGTNEDLETLIVEAHKLGLYIILDFVPNHTSDEHEWFQLSVNGDPKYKDFYIWHDGVINATTGEREEPCNWKSEFGYTAWEWNEQRQQYYLHQFSTKQPDLNFRNPDVHQAMKDVLTFWLEKGVDGFRIDALNFIYEAEINPETGTFPDEPPIEDVSDCPNPDLYCHYKHIYTNQLPEDLDLVYDWRSVLDNYRSQHNTEAKILLVEAYASFPFTIALYGKDDQIGAQVPFNFVLFDGVTNQSTAADFRYYVNQWLNGMPEGAYANWVLGNHDHPRIASRFGVQRTDLISIFLQTLPGIGVTYNGEEIGMEVVDISWEDTVDPRACTVGRDEFKFRTRDPERTPFQWDDSLNAGFSTASSTWLPVGPNYKEVNVVAQKSAEISHLKVFKRLTELRRQEPAFNDGSYDDRLIDDILIYKRQADSGDAFLVILNFGGVEKKLDLTQLYDEVGIKVQVVVSSIQSGIPEGKILNSISFKVSAYNAYVLRLIKNSDILRYYFNALI